LALAAFVVIALLPTIYKQYLVSQLLLVVAVIDLAIIWNLVAGFGGQLSLAHATFFGLGSYAVAIALTRSRIPVPLAVVAGAAGAAVLAIAVTLVTLRFRIRGIYFALVTLAVALMVRDAAVASEGLGGSVGIAIPYQEDISQLRFANQFPYFYGLIALGFILWVLSRRFVRTRQGIALRAIRDDEVAAQAVGHSLTIRLSTVMAGTAALSAVVGAIYGLGSLQASPDVSLGLNVMFAVLVATIVGGIGTSWGPLVGGIVYEGIGVVISQIPGGTGSLPIVLGVAFGVVLVGIVVLRPEGLLPQRRT
jgi:branched-chain amino acid transport system permease protein